VDVIVAWQSYPAMLCALSATSVPWLAVTGDDPRFHWTSRRAPGWAIRTAFRRATAACAPSQGLVDCYRQLGIEPRGGWFAVPNIADERAFTEPEEARRGALFVGRFVEQKDPLLAVEVALRAGAPLTLLGQGRLLATIEEAIARSRNGTAIEVVPFTPQPWEVYARHRLLLVTSLYEPFGNVIVEALAAGLPVLAVDCDFGPREILREATHSKVVERESGAIAAALAEMIDRPPTAAEAEECRRISDRYTLESVTPMVMGAVEGTIRAGS